VPFGRPRPATLFADPVFRRLEDQVSEALLESVPLERASLESGGGHHVHLA